eukprot:15365477-Ditylum_brightwellii.AAC.2
MTRRISKETIRKKKRKESNRKLNEQQEKNKKKANLGLDTEQEMDKTEDSADNNNLAGDQGVKDGNGVEDIQETEYDWKDEIEAEKECMKEERLAEEIELEKATRLKEEAWNQVDDQKKTKKKSTLLAQTAEKATTQQNKNTRKDRTQKAQSNTSSKKETKVRKPGLYNKRLKLDTSANSQQRAEKYMTDKDQMQKRGAEDIQKKATIKTPVAKDYDIGNDNKAYLIRKKVIELFTQLRKVHDQACLQEVLGDEIWSKTEEIPS